MPDGQSIRPSLGVSVLAQGAYAPPLTLLLAGLDITELDLAQETVSVRAGFLRFLIQEFARLLPFDPAFYGRAYPDVEAARLVGDVPSLHAHFVVQGYFERRQPCAMAFDPAEYAALYPDLTRAFDPADIYALRAHFVGHGWQEGRVGVAAQAAEAERWLTAAQPRRR